MYSPFNRKFWKFRGKSQLDWKFSGRIKFPKTSDYSGTRESGHHCTTGNSGKCCSIRQWKFPEFFTDWKASKHSDEHTEK